MKKGEAWAKIVGNEHVKRAVEVAIAGRHSITIIGHPDNGEVYLKKILGSKLTFVSPCPCGNIGDYSRECICTSAEVMRHRKKKKIQKALFNDILVEINTPRPKDYEYTHKAESIAEVEKRINGLIVNKVEDAKDEDSRRLFETACAKLGFTMGIAEKVKAVAQTIARLENETVVKVNHLSEAIQYRGLNLSK